MTTWESVIGLETHVQLSTKTKIFCGCTTAFGAAPNANTCPVCQGHPGVLPVLNRTVVEYAVKLGLALGCTVRTHSVFARKQYFYPDLPKGYQISQYDEPICENGSLTFVVDDETRRSKGGETAGYDMTVRIQRVHLEEDAGKNVHAEGSPYSLVDFNRAGVPLLEVVTAPDLRSPAEAFAYFKALHGVVTALGICDGNMQEGSLRCDANVSVRLAGAAQLGTRVELKNINSFRFVMQGIEHEIHRQVDVLESGGTVVQETRTFDADRGESRSMRTKEEAHDYRYFTDPDLPPVVVTDAWRDAIHAALPELPRARTLRYVENLGLKAQDARVLAEEHEAAEYFEAALAACPDNARAVGNWVINDVLREAKTGGIRAFPVKASAIGALVRMIDEGRITGKIAKELFAEMVSTQRSDPEEIAREKGWEVVRDTGAVERIVDDVLAANAETVEKLRAGKTQLLGFLVGQVMRKSGGKADPKTVNEILKRKTQ